MQMWGGKRYYSLDYYLRQSYGEKLYKLSLNGGMTCPNRDGTLANDGCIFCSEGGSGDFAADSRLSIPAQLKAAKSLISSKYSGHAYIAYFQAYTNTYAPPDYLEDIFTQALADPEVKILSVATRPDCLGPDVLDLLARLSKIKPVWIELGLQTIHEDTAILIKRGYGLAVFESAVAALNQLGLMVVVHTILGLPGEGPEQMLETIDYLSQQDIQGIKFQLLHILHGTQLEEYYSHHPFWLPTPEEYTVLIGRCISRLRPDIIVHRLTGDGPKASLIAPLWTSDKRKVLNGIGKHLKALDIWQGKEYTKD